MDKQKITDIRETNEYKSHMCSPLWLDNIRIQRLELDNYTCQVCGKHDPEGKTLDVHHYDYRHLGHEHVEEDLVTLCDSCHAMSEKLSKHPPLTEMKPDFNVFVRIDAPKVAPYVWEYLIKVRKGILFNVLRALRQPSDIEMLRPPQHRPYWNNLETAVRALCAKRYRFKCEEDRKSMIYPTLCALTLIEHILRNTAQTKLHEIAETHGLLFNNRAETAEDLGIKVSELDKYRNDFGDNSSKGPSTKRALFYLCGIAAASGIYPPDNLPYLTEENYKVLKDFADYAHRIEETA